MRRFVHLDIGEQLDRDLGVREAGSNEVGDLECRKSFRVELGFKLFQDISKFCDSRCGGSVGCLWEGFQCSRRTRISAAAARLALKGSADTRYGAARAIRQVEKRISEKRKWTTEPAGIKNVIELKRKGIQGAQPVRKKAAWMQGDQYASRGQRSAELTEGRKEERKGG